MSSLHSPNVKIDSRNALQFREIHFETLPSTNSWLRVAALTGKVEIGTVVIADHQTAGRGRLGRVWNSELGHGLTFSILFKPNLPPDKLTLFSLIAALVVKDGLEEYLTLNGLPHLTLGLRWPNDVMVENRKLAGILCEAGSDPDGNRFVVVGIGINVNQNEFDFPAELRTPASSLYLLTGMVEDPKRILPHVLRGFEEISIRLTREGSVWVSEEWFLKSGIAGRLVEVGDERGSRISGYARQLTADGALVIETSGGLKIIRSGDLTLVNR